MEDFCCLLNKMEEIGKGFERVEEEDLESKDAIVADRGDLLKELFRKASH